MQRSVWQSLHEGEVGVRGTAVQGPLPSYPDLLIC